MKKKTLIACLLLIMPILTFLVEKAIAEEGPYAPSSWSIDLLGGGTFGYFTFESKITPHAGATIRYALNPVVSVYGSAGAGQFQSDRNLDRVSFENTYQDYGLGVRFNLLRMVSGTNSVTNRVGIYTRTGLGLIVNDVEVAPNVDISGYPSQDYSGKALIYKMGGGMVLRVSRRLDFFAQAEVNFSDSDLLDGYEREPGANPKWFLINGDSYLNTSAGLSIKSGGSEVRHADWHRQDHRLDPLAQSLDKTIDRIRSEMDRTHTNVDMVHERIQRLEQSLDDLAHLVNTVHSDQFMSQYRQIEDLQNRLELFQSELEEVSGRMTEKFVKQRNRYFVVAGAFRNVEYAESLLQELQAEGFQDAEIIHDRDINFHLVTYSGHLYRDKADQELNRIRSDVNADSWIFIR